MPKKKPKWSNAITAAVLGGADSKEMAKLLMASLRKAPDSPSIRASKRKCRRFIRGEIYLSNAELRAICARPRRRQSKKGAKP